MNWFIFAQNNSEPIKIPVMDMTPLFFLILKMVLPVLVAIFIILGFAIFAKYLFLRFSQHIAVFRNSTKATHFSHAYYVPKKILSENEKEFFLRLKNALPELQVFPQVAFNAILDVEADNKRNRLSMRNRFDRKFADFVIADQNCNILVIVELDDKTHVPERDQKRDAILAEAGYQTIRYQSRNKPDVKTLRCDVIRIVRECKNNASNIS